MSKSRNDHTYRIFESDGLWRWEARYEGQLLGKGEASTSIAARARAFACFVDHIEVTASNEGNSLAG